MTSEWINTKQVSIKKATQKAEAYYKVLSDIDDPEYESALSELNELTQSVLSKPIGDASDFHNFAVGLAKNEFDHLACEVLRCGLRLFPQNCDLLSDFLHYGMNCGLQDECKLYYEALKKLPKRLYTWRGFTFGIYYLEALLDQCDTDSKLDELANEMLQLSNDFLKYLPYEEDAYRSRATIYNVLKDPQKEIDTLRDGLKHLQSAPKCALELADILVDRGEYDEALSVISRCISDNNKDQSSINEAYVYYLWGRARLGKEEKSGGEFTKDIVIPIYVDFNTALSTLKNNSYINVIHEKVKLLQSKTGINVPMALENLYDLIEN